VARIKTNLNMTECSGLKKNTQTCTKRGAKRDKSGNRSRIDRGRCGKPSKKAKNWSVRCNEAAELKRWLSTFVGEEAKPKVTPKRNVNLAGHKDFFVKE
jgi:hypothetical protein